MPIKSYICRPFSLGLLMLIKSYTVLSGPAWACLGLPGLLLFVADPFSLGLLMPIKKYLLQTFFFRIVNAH